MQRIKDIKQIFVAACDNLMKGSNENFITLHKIKKPLVLHDFNAENKIIYEAATKYGVSIEVFNCANA